MKIIHTSDLHIDSKLQTNFSPAIAKQRNTEILITFEKLFEVMENQNYDAMIIAGDMFDTPKVSSRAFSYIIELIRKHDTKNFFYVPGNHDNEAALIHNQADIPSNLHIFDESFTVFSLSDTVSIGGIKFTNTNATTFAEQIQFNPEHINIMVMHGGFTKSASNVNNSSFLQSSVKNKNIDYLALGHIHEYSSGTIDKRCTYVYPGCLEPRGFDEIGAKGFVSITIDEKSKTICHEFIKFSMRTIHEITVDITNDKNLREILNHTNKLTSTINTNDILKIVLSGTHDVEMIKGTDLIQEELSSRFYHVKVVDKSKLFIDPKDFEGDMSLKGCFVRKVLSSNLSEQEKSEIIITGLKALSGEVDL